MRQEYLTTRKYLNTAFLDNKNPYFDEQNLLISLPMPDRMKLQLWEMELIEILL